ncbi:MAG TPA: acetamidase/formamidase family protein [Thermoleophilaceae bacterium]|nr:acetamidase/formamidase family protein [Thermoleophilaceae bacterium]
MRVAVDRSTPLHEGAAGGHNRWHPDLAPIARVQPGEEVWVELRDSRDGSFNRESTHAELLTTPSLAHPLTGPLWVEGAQPGDVLEIDVLDYETDDFGWTGIWPGSGFLGDLFTEPFLARWELQDGVARSEDVPGVAIPGAPFAGVVGVAPSHELFAEALRREAALASTGAGVDLPTAELAVPRSAADGLRTFPPRENGGNIDVRDLVAGSRLSLTVLVPGALLSVGDLHFAQGDGEVCIAAIETGGAITLRCHLRRDGWKPRFPVWESPGSPVPKGRRYLATTGIPLDDDGSNADMDLNLATRRALIEMLDYLGAEHGLSRQQAYTLMSVAVQLRISEAVDRPNALVSALLPLDVFEA